MPITKAQAQTYELLVNVGLRLAFGASALAAFWVILYLFIKNPGYEYAAMEGVIGWSVHRVIGSLFPWRKGTAATT